MKGMRSFPRWLALLLLMVLGSFLAAPLWADDDDDDDDAEGEVIGVEVERPDGTYLGLAVEGNALVLRFYDEDEKEISPDAERAAAWWKPVNVGGRERVVLNPTGNALRSPARVRPPLVFFVMLTLLDENGESLGTYRFDMRELMDDDDDDEDEDDDDRY
jgi:hypothetical protein